MTKRIKFSLLTFLTAIVLLIAGFLTLSLPTTTASAAPTIISSPTIDSVKSTNDLYINLGTEVPESFCTEEGLKENLGGDKFTRATYTDVITGTKFSLEVYADSSTTLRVVALEGRAIHGDNVSILAASAITNSAGDKIQFKKAVNVWYNGEASRWQTEQVLPTTLSSFSIGGTNAQNHVQLVAGSGEMSADFVTFGQKNLAMVGDYRSTFGKTSMWREDTKWWGIVGVLAADSKTFNIFPPSGQAVVGDHLMIPKGAAIATATDTVIFGEQVDLWFNGTSWQMIEPVVLSDFTFGTNNAAGYFDIIPTSGSIPTAIVSSGANLSTAGGTFGTSSTWTRDSGATTVKFPGQVGVLASAVQNFQIFPSGTTAAEGDVITIPEGATVIVNDYCIVFGETITVTFNGVKWTGLPEYEAPSTPMTISAIESVSKYTGAMYQLYVTVDVSATETWKGWDNYATVILNGTETKADGWCFNGEHSLYVQLTTNEVANPLTLAKDTIVTICGVRYKIANDFNIYHYDGGFHTEPKPVVISDFDFGTTNCAERVDLVIKDNTLPADFVAYGAGNNLSDAGGTFGNSSTWTRDGGATTVKFPGQVGVLSDTATSFQIFPSGATAQAGDVLTIPKGATIKANGCIVEFGIEVKLTFNGTKWSGVEEVVPATPMMITGIDTTRTIYDTVNGRYGLYVTTNLTNTGATWAGWDNAANVLLNGTPTRADWCFAANGLLYVQVATTEVANPITITKGTQVTINGTLYQLEKDFKIYHYWDEFHAESKPDTTSMTLGELQSNSTFNGSQYALYISVLDVEVNAEETWIGWDNKAKVLLNGNSTKADGWCFSNINILYVQVTSDVVASPLTIAKGTPITINGILYETTNDFNIAFCSVSYTVDGETTSEYVSNVVDSSEVSDTFDYVLPELEPSNSDHVGLGWLYNGTLYKAGETLQATAGNFEVEAVSTEFNQVDGASVKMGSALEGTGIRFTARFPELSEYVTHIGILVMPTDLMTKGDFTHENYTKNVDYLEFIADVSTMEMEDFQDEGMAYYLKASVVSLYESNYRRYFSGRSFMVVDFGNGPQYVYVDYNPVENQRRICDVADAALKDVAADKISYTKDKTDMLLKYAKGALDTYAYFGPESTDEFAHYASIGMDVVWLDMVAYRYHERYQTSWTVEQEKAFYESQKGDFDLKGAFAAARQKGLRVIVYDEGIRRLSESAIPLIATDPANPQLLGLWLQTEKDTTAEILGADANESYFDKEAMTYTYSGSNYGGTGKAKVLKYMYQFESEAALKNYIAAFMSQYAKESNFYGVMLADEPETAVYTQLALVKKIIAELYPNAYAQTCQLPSYSEKHNDGDFDTFTAALQDYAQKIQGNGELGIDYYPYIKETVGFWDQILGKVETENGIRKGWLGTMQYVAQTAIKYNLDFENTIQSHAMSEGYTSVSAAELALQMHVSVGFGAKRLAYYTYNRHDEKGTTTLTMTQYIANDAALAEAVKNANAVGDNMRGAMTWFQYSKSQVYGKGSAKYLNLNHLTTSNLTKNIISSASNAVLVNEFYNEFTGEYGYYIINITIPDNNTSVTVNLTSAATVYQGTSNKKASSVTLAAGEGVFVVVS